MLNPSKRSLFTLEAVLDIAYYGADQPVQSGDISARQGIPRRYLEQSLQQLVREGLLTGLRGPRGGYRLSRPAEQITLGEILRVLLVQEDRENEVQAGSALGLSVLRPILLDMRKQAIEEFSRISLADLCQKARAVGIRRETDQRLDFII
ncbi:MAG TPA: Rrf2 family transcriptional regulator [Dongiaceae bacterium]|jgi:Rrf2 family protein|nr:Rrf2 family transcriptional regulator [Dongiaceae bacterium]